MQVEVFDQTVEVWVKVLSNEVIDLGAARSAMSEDQRELMKLAASYEPTSYYPHLVTKEEEADHGFRFEDWWIFRKAGA